VTGDVTQDYLNRLQAERSDAAKVKRRQARKSDLKAIRAV
jgi:peptide subunit release factor 1 (eRF1)